MESVIPVGVILLRPLISRISQNLYDCSHYMSVRLLSLLLANMLYSDQTTSTALIADPLLIDSGK